LQKDNSYSFIDKYYDCTGAGDVNKSGLNEVKQGRSLKRQLTLDWGSFTSQNPQGPVAKKAKSRRPTKTEGKSCLFTMHGTMFARETRRKIFKHLSTR
jgi:hypothetical protein